VSQGFENVVLSYFTPVQKFGLLGAPKAGDVDANRDPP
jgi:hypothetical protein